MNTELLVLIKFQYNSFSFSLIWYARYAYYVFNSYEGHDCNYHDFINPVNDWTFAKFYSKCPNHNKKCQSKFSFLLNFITRQFNNIRYNIYKFRSLLSLHSVEISVKAEKSKVNIPAANKRTSLNWFYLHNDKSINNTENKHN